jgi:SAM-dependent methyltransferase
MDKKYFTELTIEETPFANNLGAAIIDIFAPKSVVDVGCATGLYLKPLIENNIAVLGIDSSGVAVENAVIPLKYLVRVNILDLSLKLQRNMYDLCICLEVLEHIEAQYSLKVIKNLVQLSDTIIFSAAQPMQGGEGHVNCRPRNYWESLFVSLNFYRDIEKEILLKERILKGVYMGWFINNFMIFIK